MESNEVGAWVVGLLGRLGSIWYHDTPPERE